MSGKIYEYRREKKVWKLQILNRDCGGQTDYDVTFWKTREQALAYTRGENEFFEGGFFPTAFLEEETIYIVKKIERS